MTTRSDDVRGTVDQNRSIEYLNRQGCPSRLRTSRRCQCSLIPNIRGRWGLATGLALGRVQDRAEGAAPPAPEEGSPGGAAEVRVPLVAVAAAPVLRAFRDW